MGRDARGSQITQAERRIYLIKALLSENPEYRDLPVPPDASAQWRLLRGLMNVRLPGPIPQDILKIQNDYLRDEAVRRGIVPVSELEPISGDIYLWLGDITSLACDAIVNAANSGMTGCYIPCHACIDNCIHTYAGMELRQECAAIMARQGGGERPGRAKITGAYNLPCKYILHTVGPVVADLPTPEDERLLASCYSSCLDLASSHNVGSLAFCCVSTGMFRFPNIRAAEIAVQTVKTWQSGRQGGMKVIFNVFKNIDYEIYRDLLKQNR